jgi:hypothetical protein
MQLTKRLHFSDNFLCLIWDNAHNNNKGALIMKKTISFILAVVMLIPLTACQKTPDEELIAEKDTERMVEQAVAQKNGTPLNSLGIPDEHYIYNSIGVDGKLRIQVDAEIKVPEVETIPIIRASMGLFTQEQATGIFNFLFPNEKPKYDFGQVETKVDLEQALLQMKKNLANGNYEGNSKEQYEAMIVAIEKAYVDAPESAPEGNVSDGTLTRFSTDMNDTSRGLLVSNDTYKLSILTHTSVSGITGSQLPRLTFDCKDMNRVYSSRNMMITDGANLPGKVKQKLTISYEEAKALCDGFFAAAGMKNQFRVGAAYLIDDTGADEIPGENYAFRFHYTREVNNIPLFFDVTNGLFSNDDSYSFPWPYEHIEFVVDNRGIVMIFWSSPITTLDTITESSTLKSFDEIMELFEDISKTTYEGVVMTTFDGKVELDVTVSEIELCLLRIREKNAVQTDGLLVPAWVFFGQNKGTEIESREVRYLQGFSSLSDSEAVHPAGEGSMEISAFTNATGTSKNELVALFAINAVDGSIINLSNGY